MATLDHTTTASLDGYTAGCKLAEPRSGPSFRLLDFAHMRRATDANGYPPVERGFERAGIQSVKVAPDQPLSLGGAEFSAAAFRAGVVDELRLLMAPSVVGAGRPLELLSESGFVALHYAVAC